MINKVSIPAGRAQTKAWIQLDPGNFVLTSNLFMKDQEARSSFPGLSFLKDLNN